MANNRSRSRGATRKPNSHNAPAWALVAAGFVAGCAFSSLIYLGSVDEEAAEPVARKQEKKKPAEPEKTTTATRFDFFTLLPEKEVIVPDQDEPEKPGPKPRSSSQPAQPRSDVQYVLQAGSFKGSDDADRRRAELILLGMEAKVETVKANGDTWHRVYVGPFHSTSTVSEARATLASEGIDTLMLKRKPGT